MRRSLTEKHNVSTKPLGYTSIFDQRPGPVDLGMLAKWGTPLDNEVRNEGSQIQSPVVSPDTKLQFEQRILRPSQYGAIDNGDGSESTHRMAYAETDGKFVAYPTIVQQGKKLKQLNDREAYDYAMKKGEHRAFDTEDEAKAYAEGGYKKFWGLGERK